MEIEKNVKKLVARVHDKKTICYIDKKLKTSTKSWINIEKNE